MTTAYDVNINLLCTSNLTPQPVISLDFLFSYKYDRVIRDAQGNEAVVDSSLNPYSQFFPCRIDAQSLTDPDDFCLRLDHLFSGILNLDLAARFQLARTIVDSLREEHYRRPLFSVVAEVGIAETEFINQLGTPVMVDGVYVLDDLGGGDGSRLESLKKLIKEGTFNYRGNDGGEEECAICLENYKEGIKVVKMQCNHTFHEKCIYQWLKDKDSCPLCRRTVL